MKVAIVTGVSRGLGEAIATLFLQQSIHVIGISRSHYSLEKVAKKSGVTYTHYSKDLSRFTDLEDLKKLLKERLEEETISRLFLVNNAALLEPIDQAMDYNSKEFATHVKVNTIAPIVLMNFLLKESHERKINFIGVTITSGAAERPVYGWSAYCSTKASINMYTKTVALEQEEIKSNNKVIAFSPGVMDTQMQAEIRASSKESFKDVETFRAYKEDNKLRDPKEVGNILVDLLLKGTVENGKIYYARDYV